MLWWVFDRHAVRRAAKNHSWIAAFICVLTPAVLAADTSVPSPADPLTATIHVEDAERFARLYVATNGKPTAAQLQTDYIDRGSYAVSIFTPDRIQSATNLAAEIAKNPASYDRAIRQCLPQIRRYDADLRAIYLALHGLLPDQKLPQIYVLFGAGTSGGTAGPMAQVLGLEVLCDTAGDTPGALRSTLRRFFAHETFHTFQHEPSKGQAAPLLADALTEGAADFIARVATGEEPEPERASWAAGREGALWTQFSQDMAATVPIAEKRDPKAAARARHRWLGNYQSAPKGWPFEVGYWVGMQIWQCYYDRAADKHQAIHDVIGWNDPALILRKSGYDGKACAA